ncbi:unnamed protein product [Plutella xylostella]|uniref:(diamondback moth) hypothetical protein n=1 Tax=Plutella xylostella TaxID=51655 RepID=A0A8S4FVY3_PLUXY|nr:unnamed protein product [Plutella xylostella]
MLRAPELVTWSVLNSDYDIICISETWLLDSIFDAEIFDGRYNLYRTDRDYKGTGTTLGGGTLIAVRRNLSVDSRASRPPPVLPDADITSVNLRLGNSSTTNSLRIYSCYFPHNRHQMSSEATFCDYILNIAMDYPNDLILILGDFNISNGLWTLSSSHSGCHVLVNPQADGLTYNMSALLSLTGLGQYNHILNKNNKMLDLVISSCECEVSKAEPFVREDDHHPALRLTVRFPSLPPPASLPEAPRTARRYHAADYLAINESLAKIDWDSNLSVDDIETAVDNFYSVIYKVIEEHVPVKLLNNHIDSPYLVSRLSLRCPRFLSRSAGRLFSTPVSPATPWLPSRVRVVQRYINVCEVSESGGQWRRRDTCVMSAFTNKVAGGVEALEKEFPHMGRINGRIKNVLCGRYTGSLSMSINSFNARSTSHIAVFMSNRDIVSLSTSITNSNPCSGSWKDHRQVICSRVRGVQRYINVCEVSESGGQWRRRDTCVMSAFTNKVAGGVEALEKEFPHMVLLGCRNTVDFEGSIKWVAGGTLISDKFILTAAHVVSHRDYGLVRFALLGALAKSMASEGDLHNVVRYYKHKLYTPKEKYYDIALMELDTSVIFSDFIRPACLALPQMTITDDERILAGWGETGNAGPTADYLMKTIVKEFPANECSRRIDPQGLTRGWDPKAMICAGGERGEANDSCHAMICAGGERGEANDSCHVCYGSFLLHESEVVTDEAGHAGPQARLGSQGHDLCWRGAGRG